MNCFFVNFFYHMIAIFQLFIYLYAKRNKFNYFFEKQNNVGGHNYGKRTKRLLNLRFLLLYLWKVCVK